jgi:hypothetical protein
MPRDRSARARALTLLALLLAVPAGVAAQWPAFVRPDVPRTAKGEPDFNAPAPRLANGKPDFTGVWEARVPPSGRFGAPPLPSLGPSPPVATFANIGANVKEGVPYTPWAAELRKQRMSRNSMDNPDAHCLPMGFMQLHTHTQPRKVIHTKDEMVILYEPNYGLRQIFTDGRSLPDNDPQPWWDGYSVGAWDGDTLVVQTIGFRGNGWLDVNGSPFTEGLKLTERFHRPNYGRLEIDVTIEDPKAYTRPWTVRVNQRLAPADQLIEFVCNENERSSRHYVPPQ